jgi:hypothetical protein
MTLWVVILASASQVLGYLSGGFILHAIPDN